MMFLGNGEDLLEEEGPQDQQSNHSTLAVVQVRKAMNLKYGSGEDGLAL